MTRFGRGGLGPSVLIIPATAGMAGALAALHGPALGGFYIPTVPFLSNEPLREAIAPPGRIEHLPDDHRCDLGFSWPDFSKGSHRPSTWRMPFNMTKRQFRRIWWKTGAIW